MVIDQQPTKRKTPAWSAGALKDRLLSTAEISAEYFERSASARRAQAAGPAQASEAGA
jgi:hypothetical protein